MRRRPTSLAIVFFLVINAAAYAQQSAASGIIGMVMDTSQSAVPGATVTVTNVGTNAQRVTVTDGEGRFSVPNLQPATYHIRVELQGFQTAEIKDFVLRVGEVARPALTLGLGAITESVQVQAEAPLLQTQSASVGQVIAQKQLEELPISGRTLLNVTTIAAGVTGRSFVRGTQYGRRDQYITVEGGRDSSTNYAIDGVYVRSMRFNNMSLNPPVDSVQEVNLLRNSFSTEYGQGQAVVSIVTKSGTNRFTGSASEYFRNDALNSRNYFATEKEPYERNRFGVTAGGPILRNRLFVFGGYEGNRETKGETQFGRVPDPAFLRGDFSSVSTPILDPLTGLGTTCTATTCQPFQGNIIPQARFAKIAALQLASIPAPNTEGSNNYRVVKNFTDNTDTLTLRTDQVLSQSHSLFQRFIWYDSQQIIPGSVTDTGRPQLGRNLSLGHTWVISPTLVNEIRFGYNYAHHIGDNILAGEDYTARNWVSDIGLRNLQGGVNQQYFGRPGANIATYTIGAPGTGIAQGATENVFSISSATSKVAGTHNLRFGFQAQYRKFYQITPVGPRGGFTFNGRATGRANSGPNAVADFLLGYCSSCTGQFGTADGNYRSPTFAPFIDDVWQVSNKLTVTMGLRWEYLSPWYEIDGLEGSLDPASGTIGFHKVPTNIPPALLTHVIQQDDFFPAGIVEKDLNNFGPRLGVVYNLNDRTVLRTGYGMYYDNLNLNELQFTRLVPPFAGGYDLSPSGTALVRVDQLFPDLSEITLFPAPFSMDPTNRTAYTQQWNVNLQRTLRRDYVVEVAYTGSASRKEHKRFQLNQPREGTAPLSQRLPYPQWAPRILTSGDDGFADFKGLSFRIEKRYSAGLFFTGTYQISENIDNNSGEAEANDTAFAWDKNADKSFSRYHQRHRSSISFGCELPFGQSKRWLADGGPLAHVLGGWQINGVVRLQSGVPFSVSVSPLQSLGSFVPSRADFAPGREDDKGRLENPTPDRWFDPTAYALPPAGFQGRAGRNTLIGPPYRRADLSISKRFFIANTRLDFRGEIFNVLNTTNFGQPAANISNANAGVITSADDARNVQLSLRIMW